MSAQEPWFDDPEWEELRHKTNKKKPAHTPVSNFLKQPSASDLRRIVDSRNIKHKRQQAQQSMPRAVSGRNLADASPHNITTQATKSVQKNPAHVSKKLSPRPWAQATKTPQNDAFDEPRDNRPVQVSINLTLPSAETFHPLLSRIRLLKKITSKAQYPNRRHLKVLAGFLLLAVVIFVASITIQKILHHDEKDVLATKVEKPTYPIAKPDSTDTNTVKFDPEKKVASYADTINGVNVVVSQQPMPDTFKDDPYGQLEKLATSFSATDSFTVSDFKVYIGTSAKGPQSVLLIKDKKLIFVQSQTKIPNTEWVKYLETLKT